MRCSGPQVNATGVMPVIFSSSVLALPGALARFANLPALDSVARALAPNGNAYLPVRLSPSERRRRRLGAGMGAGAGRQLPAGSAADAHRCAQVPLLGGGQEGCV
jgi:hypothetical protein